MENRSKFTGKQWSFEGFFEAFRLIPNFRKMSVPKKDEKGNILRDETGKPVEFEPLFCTVMGEGGEIITTDVRRIGMTQTIGAGNNVATVRVYLCKDYCAKVLAGQKLPKAEAVVNQQSYLTTDPEGNEVENYSYLVLPRYTDDDTVDVVVE